MKARVIHGVCVSVCVGEEGTQILGDIFQLWFGALTSVFSQGEASASVR